MKKAIAEWTYTNDYGKYDGNGKRELFDTIEEAKEWADMMGKKNGGYFRLLRAYEIDYEKYLEIEELKKKVNELFNKIDELNEELEVK